MFSTSNFAKVSLKGDIALAILIITSKSYIVGRINPVVEMEQPVASTADVVGHNEFFEQKHIKYIKQIAADTTSFGFVVSQHLRMSGIYWGLTSLSVLGIDIIEVMDTASIVDWVMSCQDDSGG